MKAPDDLTGRRFGKLTVISQAEPQISPNGLKQYVWNCVCDCGNRCVVRGDYLKSGQKLKCRECAPLPRTKNQDKLCRNCKHSKLKKNGDWVCEKELNPQKAVKKCSGFLCGSTDKITGVKHRESKCIICGKPVYSIGRNIAIYCDEHRQYAKLDNEILDEASMDLLFPLVAGVFERAKEDYLFNTDGKKEDAKSFFRSEWANELSLWSFDAEKTIRMLDEATKDGNERDSTSVNE